MAVTSVIQKNPVVLRDYVEAHSFSLRLLALDYYLQSHLIRKYVNSSVINKCMAPRYWSVHGNRDMEVKMDIVFLFSYDLSS